MNKEQLENIYAIIAEELRNVISELYRPPKVKTKFSKRFSKEAGYPADRLIHDLASPQFSPDKLSGYYDGVELHFERIPKTNHYRLVDVPEDPKALNEAAKQVMDLAPDEDIVISQDGADWVIDFVKGGESVGGARVVIDGDYGFMHIGMRDAPEKFGPLVYDIAMQLLTSLGKLMIPAVLAGFETSDAASSVWNYYYDRRMDVGENPVLQDRIEDGYYDNFDDDELEDLYNLPEHLKSGYEWEGDDLIGALRTRRVNQ
jgi:hypothetical protein